MMKSYKSTQKNTKKNLKNEQLHSLCFWTSTLSFQC